MGRSKNLIYMEKNLEKQESGREKLKRLESTGFYVFHGSPEPLSSLEPRQAHNHIKKENGEYEPVPDGDPAVFASGFSDIAIFMSIFNKKNAPLGSRSGFSSDGEGNLDFRVTEDTLNQINDSSSGFVYVFNKDDFEQRNPSEFVSKKEVRPIKVIKVFKEDLPNFEIKDF